MLCLFSKVTLNTWYLDAAWLVACEWLACVRGDDVGVAVIAVETGFHLAATLHR